MKCENFKQAEGIVSQIKKHEKMLNDLNNAGSDLNVIIKDAANGTLFYTIEIKTNKAEHEYAKLARNLFNDIKEDLRNRINNLNSMLEEL